MHRGAGLQVGIGRGRRSRFAPPMVTMPETVPALMHQPEASPFADLDSHHSDVRGQPGINFSHGVEHGAPLSLNHLCRVPIGKRSAEDSAIAELVGMGPADPLVIHFRCRLRHYSAVRSACDIEGRIKIGK